MIVSFQIEVCSVLFSPDFLKEKFISLHVYITDKISSNFKKLNKIMEKHSNSCLISGIKLPAIGDRQV